MSDSSTKSEPKSPWEKYFEVLDRYKEVGKGEGLSRDEIIAGVQNMGLPLSIAHELLLALKGEGDRISSDKFLIECNLIMNSTRVTHDQIMLTQSINDLFGRQNDDRKSGGKDGNASNEDKPDSEDEEKFAKKYGNVVTGEELEKDQVAAIQRRLNSIILDVKGNKLPLSDLVGYLSSNEVTDSGSSSTSRSKPIESPKVGSDSTSFGTSGGQQSPSGGQQSPSGNRQFFKKSQSTGFSINSIGEPFVDVRGSVENHLASLEQRQYSVDQFVPLMIPEKKIPERKIESTQSGPVDDK